MDIKTSAILVIDLQNEYRSEGAYPVSDYEDILANAAAIIAAARHGAVPIIHVQAWVEESERSHYSLLNEALADNLRSAVAGSAGADICSEVSPERDEIVIRKRWPSAFQDTALHARLNALGVKEIFALGVWTDSCVRATVFDAIYKGYRVWLVKDACGSATETMHRAGILDMANRLYGGGVLRSEEAVKALRGEPHHSWHCSRPIEFPYTLSSLNRLYCDL
ncbi:cysteine hydrolase family protein [Paraburkholderia caffeinilytica]|uniref:Isochorismatase n=1 Tax=Paraburkholderia caffeinilytica TaxID=1761016 RepID=A0ABQ1LNG4_9BURK|nr:isochorismatase family cysteine hydrolase [Paraburkholderia caffeinilytica]GGC27271.1 isochorismatase [Paraburkholderia caffeinilytica]CAB3780163.1 Maleamate amidohydrolase [Paraburkholderia caffeinilytica]